MKAHITTYGCSANQASSEIMIASVKGLGYELVEEKDAEIVVINTCTVKYTTEQKILHKIEDLGHKGIDVVVTGCMPQVQLETILERNPDAHILGVNSI
ncbi:2-methylthioadenine synthetase, partial [Methanococcoides sp. SA1]|nr:2-methylthioadenine synthetase [Methanococcoides sp. SA1]